MFCAKCFDRALLIRKGIPMAKKKEKKKTSPVFLAVVIVLMAAVFVVQMVFPTNLGKVYGKLAQDAVEITVTKTAGDEESGSYYTDSTEEILKFGTWASEKTMRNRSLADGITADASNQVEYNFAIKLSDGNFAAMVIDERGFVHVGAELYKISGDEEAFLAELVEVLESWEEA